MTIQSEILAHYSSGYETGRLQKGIGPLEYARTLELLQRYLPPPPAGLYDIGGGPATYSGWLARQGYTVHLVDASPLHVEVAQTIADEQPAHPFTASLGDARQLELPDASAEAVLLMGPLYHLTERADRLQAWREAWRVVKPAGVVFAVGISRYASTLDGLWHNRFTDPEFVAIVQRDLIDGQHRNPNNDNGYFTTAYFHLPDELAEEMTAVGWTHEATVAIEGPGWLIPDFEARWANPAYRERLLNRVRAVEQAPTLLGVSPHILAVGRKSLTVF